ncbi:UNVERIFIED_CONTAM: hypothetical protein GTU68_010702 [Idotea baltica]|nr:hypothetical protein [Idotea baltica]
MQRIDFITNIGLQKRTKKSSDCAQTLIITGIIMT